MPTSFCLNADTAYLSNPRPTMKTYVGKDSCLTKDTVEEFITIWQALKKAEIDKPHLHFALIQFERASNEHSQEESLVDIVTAFESIVFGRGRNAPSPYGRAIGIAIGMLIGKNEAERAEIEHKLNDAYEARNLIVHGHLRKKTSRAW